MKITDKLTYVSGDAVLIGKGDIRNLEKPIRIIYDGQIIVVDTDTPINGLSRPWFLFWWIGRWSKWTWLAVSVHDYLYRTHETDRKRADEIFFALLIYKARQTRWCLSRYRRALRSRIMYKAVRKFGQCHYMFL